MANELEAKQGLPEGESALHPGTETAPEQENDEHDTNTNEADADEEGKGSAEGREDNGDPEGTANAEEESPKPKKKQPWELRRIAELTAKQREAERELERVRAENERLRSGAVEEPAPADLETLADRRAREIFEQREHQAKLSAWDQAGVKEYGREDFNQACNLVASLMDDRQRQTFMQHVTDSDVVEDGHKVIMKLAEDPEEAERILSLPPVKQALALSRMAAAMNKPAAAKPISRTPAPVRPITGGTPTSDRLEDPEMSMDKFADKFLSTLKERRR